MVTFYFCQVMEKSLRVLGGEDDGHSHSHAHSHLTDPVTGMSSSIDMPSKDGLRTRTTNVAPSQELSDDEKINATSRLS